MRAGTSRSYTYKVAWIPVNGSAGGPEIHAVSWIENEIHAVSWSENEIHALSWSETEIKKHTHFTILAIFRRIFRTPILA